MHRIHSGFTAAIPIKNGKAARLREVLQRLSNEIAIHRNDNSIVPLCNFKQSPTVLFASAVILPAQTYCNETLPETLIFATTYCGPFQNHLDDLVKNCSSGLCEMFRYCNDFPDGVLVRNNELKYYLRQYKKTGAFNSRYSCITKQDVENEKNLRSELENHLDFLQTHINLNGQCPTVIKTLIERHIKAQIHRFSWARDHLKMKPSEYLAKHRVLITIALLVLLVLSTTIIINPGSMGWLLSLALGIVIITGIVAIVIMILVALLFIISRKKHITAGRPSDCHVREVALTQLRPIINEMTAAAPLKAGVLRRYFYSAALTIVNFARAHLMNVPTVSSIRWLSIDNKKRLLFLSNYSNTTDFYVREFLTGNTPRGVNFMFTNGCGFPDARLLHMGGIRDDPEGYMNVIHTYQHVTDLWYAHDYELTIDQILRNRKIRSGLFTKMNEKEAKRWLNLL